MTETLCVPPISEAPSQTDETLRLLCPTCGGGLNLKRRHLGVAGQCVHCESPLMAVEEDGEIRITTQETSGVEAEGNASERPALGFTPASQGLPAIPAPLPGREEDNLFPKGSEDASAATRREPEPASSPFGGTGGFSHGFSSMFGQDEAESAITPAWGTGSAAGGGFAEDLFREKVVKEADQPSGGSSFSLNFAQSAPVLEEAPPQDTPAGPGVEQQARVILDGDGRPMKPMTKEEEAEFAKNIFKYGNARSRSGWAQRLRKKLIRLLVGFVVLGFVALGATFFVPKETLVVWQGKVVEWLEPGAAIFDYLPEGLRPDWLPRTDFGIDGGLDENGKPKPKLNALQGLDKLKGDVGAMRGSAEAELKALNEK